jgi:hypothetical protein
MVRLKRPAVWLLGAVTLGCVEVPGLAECSAGSPCEPGAVCESGTCVPSGDASTSGPDASSPPAPDATGPSPADATPRPDAARPPTPDARPPQPDGADPDAGEPDGATPPVSDAGPPPTPDMADVDAAIPDQALPPPPDMGLPPTPDMGLPPTPDMGLPPTPDMALPPVPDAAVPPTPDMAVPPLPDMAVPPTPDMAVPPTPDMAVPDMAPPPTPDMAVPDAAVVDAALPPPDPTCPHPLPWSREYTLWALTDAAFEAYDPTAVFADDAPLRLRSAPLPDAGLYRPGDLTLLPDGERALVFGAGGDVAWRGAIQTVDLTDGEVLTRSPAAVPAPAAGVRAAALAPGGRTAFTLFGNATRTVTSIDLDTGAVTPLGTVDDGAVLAVAWSGTPVVAGGERLSVPDPAGAVEIGTVPGAGALTGLLADPDEERVFAWGGSVLARAVLDGRASAEVVSVEPFGGEGATVLAATVRGDIVLALGRTPTPAAEVTLARLDASTLAVLDTVVVSADAPVGDDAFRLAATYDAELVAVGAVGGTSLQVFTVADLDPAGPPAVLGAPLRDLALWAPVAEVCDGLDEDCDGETDEDWDVGGNCNAPGVCGAGTWVCAGPRDRRCDAYDRAAAADACNGLDDDCDGATDEDVPYLGAAVRVDPETPSTSHLTVLPMADGPFAGEIATVWIRQGRLGFARFDADLNVTAPPLTVPGPDPVALSAAWNGDVIGVAYLSIADTTSARFVVVSPSGELLAGPHEIDELEVNARPTAFTVAAAPHGRFAVKVNVRESPNRNTSFVTIDPADLAATAPPTMTCAGNDWLWPLFFDAGAFIAVGNGHGCEGETYAVGRRWDTDGQYLEGQTLTVQESNHVAYPPAAAFDAESGTFTLAWVPVSWSPSNYPFGQLRFRRFNTRLVALGGRVDVNLGSALAFYNGQQLFLGGFSVTHNADRDRIGLWFQRDRLGTRAGWDDYFTEVLPNGVVAETPILLEERTSGYRWPWPVWFQDRYIFGGYRTNLGGGTSAHLRAGPVFCDAVAAPGAP